MRRAAAIVVACLCLSAAGTGARAVQATAVVVSVSVPQDTPGDSPIYIAGNLLTPAWRPNGVRMDRQADGLYAAKLDLAAGATFEYKFTRGSWETVEKSPVGADISNRRAKIEAGLVINDTVARWGNGASASTPPAHTLVGRFKTHANVTSTHLANPRTVMVYLPPDYDAPARATARYPVLYMHDGQNLFDRATGFGGQEWQMDETAEALIASGKIQPLIIVGVNNTAARMTEYTPVGASPAPGKNGDDYARFLIEELKPFVDKTYRTRPGREDTAVAGSSLGGLISLELAMTRPDVFGKAGVVSASLFWNDRQALKQAAALGSKLREVKYWVDMGTKEGGAAPGETVATAVLNARRLVDIFKQSGLVPGRDYVYLEVPDGEHNETWWARRMDQMLMFLFPAKQGQHWLAPERAAAATETGIL